MKKNASAGLVGVCLWGVLATLLAGPALAADTNWQHDPATPGDWFLADNWSDGVPDINDDTYVQRGTAEVASGTATAYHLYVAETGNAEIVQSGGEVELYRRLFLGMTYGVTGTYTMTDGSMAVQNNEMYVGYFGHGVVRQTGGSISASEKVYMGWSASAYGVYEIGGDATLLAKWLYIGSNGSGEFIQSGGTVSLPASGGGDDGRLELARYYDSHGTYALSDGRLECDSITVGTMYTGTGEFRHTGGDAIARYVTLGMNDENVGTYELSGPGRLEADKLVVAEEGTGAFTQSDGEVAIAGDLCIGMEVGSEGTLTTSGGKLQAGHLYNSLYHAYGGGYGSGVLKIEGSGATVLVGAYDQGDKGSLVSLIDTTGLAPVHVTGVASLDGTWTVLSEEAPLGRFDVLVAEGGLSGGFDSVDLPSSDWSWGIDDGEVLWANHTPEPATLGLLAGGVAALWLKRRRKA